MADGYGNSLTAWRCHVYARVISSTDTTDTLRVEARWQAVNGYNLNGFVKATVWINGTQVGHTDNSGVRTVGTNAEVTVLTGTLTVNKTGSARGITCSASINFPGSWHSGTSNASCSVSVAGISYKKPNAPSGLTVARNGDTGAKLSWRNNPDNNALKPYGQVIVDRRSSSNGGAFGAWSMIASLPGSASNYTATGLKANGRYQFRILARNSAGDSPHVESATIYTTPAAPKSVTVVKKENGSISVTADVSNSYPSWVTLWRKAGDGDWMQLRDQNNPMALSGGKATYADATAPAGDVQYKCFVRRVIIGDAKTTDLSKTLVSTETVSNTVTTISPPNAPTVTSPKNGSVYETGANVTVSWTPNHPDGTDQSAAQIEITPPSGDTIIESKTNETEYAHAFDRDGSYRLRVRTKGLHADWGAWSNYVSFTVASPPNVILTVPDVVTTLPFSISWSVADHTGVSQQIVGVRANGVSYAKTVSSSSRSLQIGSDWVHPRNGETILISVMVRGGSSLSSTVSKTSRVSFMPPARPTVSVAYADDYQAMVTVGFNRTDPGDAISQNYWTRWTGYENNSPSVLADFYTAWQGEANNSPSVLATLDEGLWHPETVKANVYRIMPDGTQTLVENGLADGQQAVDRLPPLNTDYEYRVETVAESGATASVTIPAHLRSNVNVLNFGTDAGEVLPLGLGQSVSRQVEHDTNEFDFADGSPYATSYESGLVSSQVSTSDQRAYDQDTYQRIRMLAETYAFAWFRDAAGITEYVKVSLQVGYDVTATPRTITCTADMTRQAWKDPL